MIPSLIESPTVYSLALGHVIVVLPSEESITISSDDALNVAIFRISNTPADYRKELYPLLTLKKSPSIFMSVCVERSDGRSWFWGRRLPYLSDCEGRRFAKTFRQNINPQLNENNFWLKI